MGKRPGFRREKPVYLLRFEDDQFDGLEVTAKSLPLGEFFALQRLQEKANDDADAAEQVVRKLSEVLVSWNLEDDEGKPVPCEFSGVATLDLPFVLAIMSAWMEAVASVPNRSPGNSNGGGTSLEPSIPMEPA
jgi:hypothetical protein